MLNSLTRWLQLLKVSFSLNKVNVTSTMTVVFSIQILLCATHTVVYFTPFPCLASFIIFLVEKAKVCLNSELIFVIHLFIFVYVAYFIYIYLHAYVVESR